MNLVVMGCNGNGHQVCIVAALLDIGLTTLGGPQLEFIDFQLPTAVYVIMQTNAISQQRRINSGPWVFTLGDCPLITMMVS